MASQLNSLRQITSTPHGHILANRNCWTADGHSLLYDVRDDETRFTGQRIERVDVDTGEVETLYRSPGDSCCGVPTCSPVDDRYVFIHGPENQTDDWPYCAWHRRGEIGRQSQPNIVSTLDARDIAPPFTPGALRGGTHLHTFNPNGSLIASTYEDHVLATASRPTVHTNRRVIAVSVLGQNVRVPKTHSRNHDGISFTVVVTEVAEHPKPGSDEIYRAYSEAWIDNSRIAFQADVCGSDGKPHSELYIASLGSPPFNMSKLVCDTVSSSPGTLTTRIGVPPCVVMRRLTYTEGDLDSGFSGRGLSGPRHWAVASPEGDWIGCFRRDHAGHAQFCIVSSRDGQIQVITNHEYSATSAFTWHPDGKSVAYAADGSIFQVFVDGREPVRLTEKMPSVDGVSQGPTHHACVFSPAGNRIAFIQPVLNAAGLHTQIFTVETDT